MNTSTAIKADILKSVWSQDMQGVESIRTSIYNVISGLTVAPFALSSFLLKDIQRSPHSVRVITDVLVMLFVWVVFLLLKHDLRERRKALVLRQRLIENLDEHSKVNFEIFADASKEDVDISDNDLFWMPAASTAAILVKALVVWQL